MTKLKKRFHQFAEGVSAAMLAAIFFTFLLQILSRYVLAEPFGWSLEVCLTLWIWLVFWGNSFASTEDSHVTFDMLYLSVRPGLRRVFALISAGTIVIALSVVLWPTWDYIDFLKIKKSATLRIPMRTVFSIYMVFLIATIVSYSIRFVKVFRHGTDYRLNKHEDDI